MRIKMGQNNRLLPEEKRYFTRGGLQNSDKYWITSKLWELDIQELNQQIGRLNILLEARPELNIQEMQSNRKYFTSFIRKYPSASKH